MKGLEWKIQWLNLWGLQPQDKVFLVINDIPNGENAKSCATLALIEVLQGVVLDKQIDDEFKTLAGKESTWRWYAKILNDNLFQMRFPTAKSLLTVSHFIEMRMRNVPSAVIKVKNGRMTQWPRASL